MIKFSKEKVLLLHQLIAEETGGAVGLRDEAVAALYNIWHRGSLFYWNCYIYRKPWQ